MEKLLQTTIAQLQSIYQKECSDAVVDTGDCQQLRHQMEQMEFNVELFNNLPAIVYVGAAINMFAGAVGLYAVFKSNALAAKVYLWTWLPRFLVGLVGQYQLREEMKQIGIDGTDGTQLVLSQILGFVFLLYYIKVVWSFYQRLKVGNSSSPSGDVESIQLA
ncbi:unnamed protein product [Ectocarpus fasciculatus]